MDLYILNRDTFLKDEKPIDTFTSLIWTERYNASGDVTLVFPTDSDVYDLINEGTFLWTPDSVEVMMIDTISSEDGETTATGESLIGFLKNRMLRNTWATTSDSWNLVNDSSSIANYIIAQMCMPGGAMAGSLVLPSGIGEVIPNLTLGPDLTGVSRSVAIPFGNVYDGVKMVCDLDALGFRMYPPNIYDGTGNLKFETYRGLDRTTDQTTNGIVIFEPALDTLTDVKELRSIAGYKNLAYVWCNGMTSQSQIGIAVVPGPTPTGFDRRTLMVTATDVNAADYSTTAALTAVLNQKGVDALANNNYVRMTDGQIVPQSNFVYGTDYNLGDVIELRGTSDIAQQARVTEYIRSQDSTGETAYPTLSVIT